MGPDSSIWTGDRQEFYRSEDWIIKRLFDQIKYMAEEIDSAIVFFSTGKDSIVLLDLCNKHIKKTIVVYLYMVPDLEYKNAILEKYEKLYNIKIHQYPLWDVGNVYRNYSGMKMRKLKQVDVENYCRSEFDIPYVSYGYKMVDSVFRGGILNSPYIDKGIDRKNKRLYPISRWSGKEVFQYIKIKKLPLPIEYKYGFRDIQEYKPESLQFIRSKFPNDYKKIIEFYPFLAI